MESSRGPNGFRALALIIGTFFIAACFAVERQPFVHITHDDVGTLQSVCAGVGSSFFFVLILDLLEVLRSGFNRGRFRLLFGKEAILGHMKLVYPDFVICPEVIEACKDMKKSFFYSKRSTRFPGLRPIDLTYAAADNDVQGAVIVASVFGSMSGRNVPFVSDSVAIWTPECSFVSFGLTSNDMTLLYLESDKMPLFRYGIDEQGWPTITTLDKAGKDVRTFHREEGKQYAIILKYRPDPRNFPERVWIICAGLGAAGTPAASWHLVTNWKVLAKRFRDSNFLIVLKCSDSLAAYQSAFEVDAVSFSAGAAGDPLQRGSESPAVLDSNSQISSF